MRAIIHIGMHKTGMTSVKDHCRKHRDALLGDGVLFPTTLRGICKKLGHEATDLAGLEEGFAMELAQIPDGGAVYIGSENFFDLEHAEKERLLGFLDRFHLDVSVLCYLRPQVRQAVSYYQQHVIECFRRKKRPANSGVVEHFDALMNKGYYRYSHVLDSWSRYLPRGSLCVKPYGADVLHGGCTVRDAASIVGFGVSDADIVKRQVSFSAEKLYLLETFNAWTGRLGRCLPRKIRKEVMRILARETDGLPLDISREEKLHIARACADDNERLAAKYLSPEAADMFLDQDVDSVVGKVPADVRTEDVARLFGRLNAEIPALAKWKPRFFRSLRRRFSRSPAPR
jgi:hypothetical protein